MAVKTSGTSGVLLSVLLAWTPVGRALAQTECAEDAMIVFDGSGSMSEMGFNHLDEPRIFEARRAIRRVMPKVEDFRRIGLITYGPSRGDSCAGVTLRFEPMEKSAYPIMSTIDGLQPDGETPLTDAVRQASELLIQDKGRGTVVLVTDGKETCGGAPCRLAATLAADWPGITVHVIGFKVRGEQFSWSKDTLNDYTDAQTVARCLADQTGGEYLNTETVDQLVSALSVTLGCPYFGWNPSLNPTTPKG